MARKKDTSGWHSTETRAPGALTRLRTEFRQSSGAIVTPARELLAARHGGPASKALAFAELLVDLSVSPIGRVITAGLALTAAWALL